MGPDRMLNDTLTIGLILVLLFGSIALYLYTCIQQSEQKVSLLESILLDLKMSAEIKSYTELPIDPVPSGGAVEVSQEPSKEYVPFDDNTEDSVEDSTPVSENVPAEGASGSSNDEVIDIDEYKSAIADAVEEQSPNYESMSLKELQSLAKSRNIVGVTKKGPLIEALKTSDRSSTVKPASVGAVGSNSFLETSASVSDESL